MSILEAVILGLVQGLTEFLPVSSSGHLEIGHALFGFSGDANLTFDIVLHGATMLSTIVVFRNEIWSLIKGLFAFKWNEPTKYVAMLLLSAVPVGIAGLLFEDQIDSFFTGNIVLIGCMLIVTSLLLAFAYYRRRGSRKIGFIDSLVIGIAQMIAVIPGISRSGATIATGMLIGNEKSQLAKFSFLMVIIPILGANLLKIVSGDISSSTTISTWTFLAGFVSAFISGLLACKWMIKIVSRGKIIYFAIYCLIIGVVAIIFG